MTILNNAIDSIQLGIEDYELIHENPKRLISCTRNLFSGILLLFKHYLSELSDPNSDEVLIKEKIKPKFINCQLVFVGDGPKTVDVQGIQKRFKNLDVEVDWKELEKIQKYRNNIEHYFSTDNPKTIEAILTHSFNIINDFVRAYLNEEPSKLLGQDYWQKLLDVKNVYDKEKLECLHTLGQNTYFSAKQESLIKDAICSHCGSDLLKPIETQVSAKYTYYECVACNHELSFEQVINSAVSVDCKRHYGYHHYKDGGSDPYAICPECGEETYSMEEQICLCCEENAVHECERCFASLSPEEVTWNEGYCSYCVHQWEKLKEE